MECYCVRSEVTQVPQLTEVVYTMDLCFQPLPREAITVGSFCLAPFEDETREYYRARIEKLDRERNPTKVQVRLDTLCVI